MAETKPTKCTHPFKNVISIGEYQQVEPMPFNSAILVEKTVRRLYCLGCGREFEVEVF
jgi:hypothetical protein